MHSSYHIDISNFYFVARLFVYNTSQMFYNVYFKNNCFCFCCLLHANLLLSKSYNEKDQASFLIVVYLFIKIKHIKSWNKNSASLNSNNILKITCFSTRKITHEPSSWKLHFWCWIFRWHRSANITGTKLSLILLNFLSVLLQNPL